MNILIKDTQLNENFYPFSILHPLFELRCGALRIFEKWKRLVPEGKFTFHSESDKINSFLTRFEIVNLEVKSKVLEVESNFVPNRASFLLLIKHISENENSTIEFTKDNFTFAKYDGGDFNILSFEITEADIIQYLWDAIYLNEKAINDDFLLFEKDNKIEKVQINGAFINSKNIFFGKNVNILPNVVLDASEGAIIIDDKVKIMAQATIIGPCYIGKNTIIKVGAKIYEKTSIGEWCKIGGEVENSIIQAYSNKQHEGFLGHSFLSEWVNLGADTNTSDLKNTYANINLRIKDKDFETGRMFLGLFCGDHTKSAINTQFNTGTVAGICGILVVPGFLPNYIPSFSWGGKSNGPIYKVSKALEVAKIVMARRKRELNQHEEALIIKEYEQ
ncbi:MAG: putative sugar nucleotidyl transferase [Candidatus Kapabacteria bacterium]|nr:putative sugar nucleotidyl transferase [Candidatus Kapabacteria bacterium]